MSMIKCPECGGNISSRAVFCPHCGCPMSEQQSGPVYELTKGKTERSGLSTFLKVLAWILRWKKLMKREDKWKSIRIWLVFC